MKQYQVTTLSLVLVAVMAVAFAGCGVESATTGAPAEPEGSATKPAAAPAEPAGSATEAPAAGSATEAAAGEALTATSIVGSSWDVMGMMKLTFEADGVLQVDQGGEVSTGEWAIDGSTLTVTAGGEEHQADIEGDKITYGGMALERLQ